VAGACASDRRNQLMNADREAADLIDHILSATELLIAADPSDGACKHRALQTPGLASRRHWVLRMLWRQVARPPVYVWTTPTHPEKP